MRQDKIWFYLIKKLINGFKIDIKISVKDECNNNVLQK